MQAIVDIERRFGAGLLGDETFSSIESAYAMPSIDPIYRDINLFPSDYIVNILGPYPPMGDLPGDPSPIPVPKETEPKTGQPVEMPKVSSTNLLILLGLALLVAKYS